MSYLDLSLRISPCKLAVSWSWGIIILPVPPPLPALTVLPRVAVCSIRSGLGTAVPHSELRKLEHETQRGTRTLLPRSHLQLRCPVTFLHGRQSPSPCCCWDRKPPLLFPIAIGLSCSNYCFLEARPLSLKGHLWFPEVILLLGPSYCKTGRKAASVSCLARITVARNHKAWLAICLKHTKISITVQMSLT